MGVGTRVPDNDDDFKDLGPDRIHRFLDGDAYLHARTQAALVIRSRRYRIRVSDQADLIQTVLAEACEAMAGPEFTFQKSIGAFIRTLAHRRCIDWVRRNRPNSPLEIDRPSLSPLPDEKIIANERAVLATEILSQLSPTCRELIQKHIFQGLSYAEIAAGTGRTEGALRVEMHKCLGKARELARRGPGSGNGRGNADR